jgi:hypothetical protein
LGDNGDAGVVSTEDGSRGGRRGLLLDDEMRKTLIAFGMNDGCYSVDEDPGKSIPTMDGIMGMEGNTC